jgi:hypothetical protein
MTSKLWKERRYFIGGSDARIIMGDDEGALIRLWRQKRGEVEPEDLSGNLIVQLGLATEDLNRRWYEANTAQVITDIQKQVRHPVYLSAGCQTCRWTSVSSCPVLASYQSHGKHNYSVRDGVNITRLSQCSAAGSKTDLISVMTASAHSDVDW